MPHIDPERELVGWSLSPIYSDPDPTPPGYVSFATAAVMSCIATGQMISGNGGPGYALSAKIVEQLDKTRGQSTASWLVDEPILREIAIHAWKASDPQLLEALQNLYRYLDWAVPGEPL